jgi:hypothetical protein
MAQLNSGSIKYTSTGAVGVANKPVTVYSLSWLSNGSGAGVPILGDGPTGAVERFRATGTTSQGSTVYFGANGKYFPVGCYLTVDANTTYVDVDFAMQA